MLNAGIVFISISFLCIYLQEQYMEVVNPFILKNKERMIVFLDQLSLVTDPNPPLGMFVDQSINHNSQDTGIIIARVSMCL